ncbi:MAG: YeeE/YedE family protein [Rhodospirillaceae bacterium]
MEPLSPLMALSGGFLIGMAAGIFLLLNGRVAGISGLLAVTTRVASQGAPWPQATAFIVGLPLGAAITALLVRQPDVVIGTPAPVLAAAGLLVGYGTRLGNGCTSGHGVCGISRLSPRSIVATFVFMASAAATVFVVRHIVGA